MKIRIAFGAVLLILVGVVVATGGAPIDRAAAIVKSVMNTFSNSVGGGRP